jgi:hypothetical protein
MVGAQVVGAATAGIADVCPGVGIGMPSTVPGLSVALLDGVADLPGGIAGDVPLEQPATAMSTVARITTIARFIR